MSSPVRRPAPTSVPGGGPLRVQVEEALLRQTSPGPKPLPWAAVLGGIFATVTLLTASVVVVVQGAAEQGRAAEPTAVSAPVGITGVPLPVRVRIAHLGVDSPLEGLDVQSDGQLAAPKAYGNAGWFEQGIAPGQVGPAVIAGHIDSQSGPAVFFKLHTLAPGDVVDVDRDDGSTVEFAVTRVETVPKAKFPTGEVYGPTQVPELRLVTCGGAFDRRKGSYVDNTVVFATVVTRT